MDADGAELVLLPIAALGSGVFVPVGSAEDIREAIAVHVEGSDAFSVVVAEAMDEEGGIGNAIGAGTWCGLAELGGMGRVLCVGGDDRERDKGECDVIFHLPIEGAV